MAPPPDNKEPLLRVAIAGAGIAGLAAAVALSRDPRVDVQLFDKASALREIGASIALGPNGLRTLDKLGVGNALDDEVAFRGPSGLPMIYRWVETSVFFFFFPLLSLSACFPFLQELRLCFLEFCLKKRAMS